MKLILSDIQPNDMGEVVNMVRTLNHLGVAPIIDVMAFDGLMASARVQQEGLKQEWIGPDSLEVN